MDTLPSLGVFADLEPDALETLASYGTFARFDKGSLIINEGTPQNKFYFFISGQGEVSKRTKNNLIKMVKITAGECVGETYLFNETTSATATVATATAALVWKIEKKQMVEFIVSHPNDGVLIVARIMELLSNKISMLNEELGNVIDQEG